MDPGFRRGDTEWMELAESRYISRGSTQSVETLWFKAAHSIAASVR